MDKLRMALLAPAFAVVACSPTYAPPIRSTHYGAPGRLGPGQGEVALSAGSEVTGTGMVGLPLTRNVRVELAGDGSSRWVVGSAGLRVTAAPVHNGAVGDVEGGVGGGVGGELCGNDSNTTHGCDGGQTIARDGRTAAERTAFGGYLGGGLGYRYGVFTLFGRARGQVSSTTDVPVTLWWSTLVGGEFRIGPVNAYAAAGIAGYTNSLNDNQGPLIEGGVSVPFTVR